MRLNDWMRYLRLMSECTGQGAGQNIDHPDRETLNSLLEKVAHSNRWFTRYYLDYALNAFANNPEINDFDSLFLTEAKDKTLGFWMRPLSPFDGFDLVLLSLNAGCRCIIRASETDAILYKGVIDLLENRFPYLKGKTEFLDRPFGDVDALVISGEDPTSVQLDYFAKRPVFVDAVTRHLTTAVLTGEETSADLDALAMDLCMFFGRSKYSISKIAVPLRYDFSALLKSLESYRENGNHSGYFNHYEYRKAAYIVSGLTVFDNGFLILKKETGESHSIGVVDYIEYGTDGMAESDSKGRKISKAKPEYTKGELVFGSAWKRNFNTAGEFLLFLKGI